jgi:transcriptional regulator with XRE-family HTH domain
MVKKEFAPLTPGEILEEEFLAEYGLSQNQLAKTIGISPNRIAEIQSSAHHGRYRTAAEFVFWQQSGILDEPSDPLRPQEGAGKSEA